MTVLIDILSVENQESPFSARTSALARRLHSGQVCEAIFGSATSFTRGVSLRLLRREARPPRKDGKGLTFFSKL